MNGRLEIHISFLPVWLHPNILAIIDINNLNIYVFYLDLLSLFI